MAENVNVKVSAPAHMAAQRYFNKGTGRMEAPHKGFEGHPVPAGHQVASTTHTVTTHPTPQPQSLDLFHMSDAQRLAYARNLVGQEVTAGRIPFQQAEQRLAGQEGATRENTERLATQGNQQGASLVASQKQSGEAGEQRAREAQTQAKLTTDQHGAPAPSRQEALLQALGQGGVNQAANARAAGEKWAQSQASGYQQQGTAAVQAVGTRFGAERQDNRNKEAAYVAKGLGQTNQLYRELTGEKEKLQTAREGLGLTAAKIGQAETASQRTAATAQRGQALTNRAAERGHQITAQNDKESRELQERGQNLTRASAQERTEATREHTHVYAEIQQMTHGGQKPSRAAGLKWQALIDTAYGYAKALKASGKSRQETEAAMRIGEGTGKGGEEGVGYSPDIIRAAINLTKYQRLGPNDKKLAAGYGLTPQLGHPEWFKSGNITKPKPGQKVRSEY